MAAPTRDASWTVGTDRDLPIVPGDWDGVAAEASVFAWAGFDDGKPEPEKARRAFLVYDADAPELKGSYKLPIAEYRDGGLRVVKGGMDAAAGYLPKTDAPQDVLDRARDVLGHYYAKWDRQQSGAARDALRQQEHQTMTTKIEIGFGRDSVRALTKLGKPVFAPLTLALDEIDADKLQSKLSEMESVFGDLIEMANEAKGEAKEAGDKYDGAVAEMADMMSVAEATAKIDEIKAMLAEAEKALAESKAAEETAAAERDAAKQVADALEADLAPYRAAELEQFRANVIALGFDKAKVDACQDSAEIKRLVVVSKVGGDRYSKTRDDGSFIADDALVAAAFEGIFAAGIPATTTAPPSATFAGFPRIELSRDADNDNQSAPASHTAAQVQSGMACL
jgi:hypothetical protein